MKTALIATLFNEADNFSRWWDCILKQTMVSDEIVIVDGGSTDGTWEQLQNAADASRVPVRLQQRRCNIAEGRNLAIKMTNAEIIACTDAGSFPDPTWFEEIMRTFAENPGTDVVGGRSVMTAEKGFQLFLQDFESKHDTPTQEGGSFSSSRNIAFRRSAWEAVGGYPEWLTLTAEDALFNRELHALGIKFTPNLNAIVRWPLKESAESYFKMLRWYAFGAAEAGLYTSHFARRLLLTLFPPLLLLSHRRFKDFKFRYLKNAAGATGWIAGFIKGRKPPPGWKKMDGILMSPEAQESLRKRKV